MSEPANGKPKVTLPDGKEVGIRKARLLMDELTEEAASLREDDSNAAKSRRVTIARDLRAIQKGIDALDPIVEVVIPPDASKQFPFRIGPAEFWPGTHRVRGAVAQTLRYMMDRHRAVESHIHVSGGNIDPLATGIAAYGKEINSV